MQIKKDYNLIKLNTLGININAKFFIEINKEEDLTELLVSSEFKQNKRIFLGGGSNILFIEDFNGIVILNKLKGIEVVSENSEDVLVKSMGGEMWHDFVIFTVNNGYWGVENLSLIPGTVGAAPIQNIGAYGAELKDSLFSVETFDLENGKKKIFSKEECVLGYRDSIFKNKLKGKYFILSVTFKLSKTPKPNISYKILYDYLENLPAQAGNKIKVLSPKDVSDAVVAIRKSKLPDPKILGNAGSFFKNVPVPLPKLEELLQAYPNLPYFKEKDTTSPPTPLLVKERGEIQYKIPAGWLIEQCGPLQGGASWKGYRMGSVGVHDKQALVLVNYGGATGKEILILANKIIFSVKEKFGLELVPEVNIV